MHSHSSYTVPFMKSKQALCKRTTRINMAALEEPLAASDSLRVYIQRVQEELRAQEQRVQELEDYAGRLQETKALVEELPRKLKHQVMVPFGKRAFFLGQLVHTNEVTVHLGAGVHAEVTAPSAAGILDRRLARVKASIAAGKRQLESHRSRLDLSGAELGPQGNEMEIRQSYEESEALLASAQQEHAKAPAATAQEPVTAAAGKPAAGDEDAELARLFARMDELEAMEAAAEAAGDDSIEATQPDSGTQSSWQRGSLQRVVEVPEEEEGEADSDDEEQDAGGFQQQRAQDVQGRDSDDDEDEDIMAAFAPVRPTGFKAPAPTNTASNSRGSSPAATGATTSTSTPASSRATPSSVPSNSGAPAFKKGFLLQRSPASPAAGPGAASSSRSSGMAGAASPASVAPPQATPTSSTSTTTTASTSAAAPAPSKQGPPPVAFTGQVLERPGLIQEVLPGLAIPSRDVVQGPQPVRAVTEAAQAAPAPAAEKRVSKFRLQRMQQQSG